MFDILFVMPPEQLAAFIAGGLVVNFAPGADAMFATACGIQGGPRVGAAAGFGAGVGVVWHVTLAALGVSALIALYPQALDAVRWLGAAYLLYLGWKAWQAGASGQGRGMPTAARAFRRGVLTNMLNPKPVLFVLAFLPQFVEPQVGPVWQQIVALGSIFAFTGTLVTMGYGALAGYVGQALGARMEIVNKVASVMFVGLAAKLVLDAGGE
ncbi:LysE family translocator [Rhodobacter ferrooxidans]|uniref:Lysine exporter protein (LYSE/YGGA) n=1 Tax=Rhodobacter ferrooxidans TaxID=371731 RepID=C8RXE4_9RHOB|nr:LysE family translocator [Rhodobacter sp. SW2]EEW26669.1 Lysine exporter protein (LYSE/YGGA) [Rhodobacter sp. SW2]